MGKPCFCSLLADIVDSFCELCRQSEMENREMYLSIEEIEIPAVIDNYVS